MKKFLIVGACLFVAACGSGGEGDEIASGTVTGSDGETVEYSVRGEDDKGSISINTGDGSLEINSKGKGSRAELPYGLKLPAGAEIKANINVNQSGDGTSGSMVSFETNDSSEKVINAIKEQAKSAGFEIKTEINSGDSKMFHASRGDKETINVTASQKDGKTAANVIAGGKK